MTTLPKPARVPSAASILSLAAALMLAGAGAADETVVIDDPAEGSVAPYVPTVDEDVELMLEVAGVGPGDYVIDLGAGDGRIVIAAARRGAFGHGVEIEPELVDVARRNARAAGVAERTAFVQGDVFEADVADASVVTLYLFPDANIALRPKLLSDLAPGTRVVSNSFDMGDWEPDLHDMSARSSGGVLLWIIPADVGGEWALEIDEINFESLRYSLHLEQRYQQVSGRFRHTSGATNDSAGANLSLSALTLRGDRLSFLAADNERGYAFSGRVDGDTMHGYVQIRDSQGEQLRRWRAVR